jgi:hypothetical protein
VRKIGFVILISGLVFAVGCGGSGGSPATPTTPTTPTTTVTSTPGSNTIVSQGAANVAPLIVDAGPASIANTSNSAENMAFTIVTVCVPTTGPCVTIDHVAVDTGSVGLRILSSAVSTLTNGPAVLAALPNVNTSTPVAECYPFVLNYAWGGVRSADVKMGGTNNISEVASAVPILVMGDTSIPLAPSTCTAQTVGSEMNSVAVLGANGLLGVGNFQYDCDVPGLPIAAGSSSTFGVGSSNPCTASTTPPSTYYTCSGSTCTASLVLATQQIRNPVSMFAIDNNGVILELPAVPVGGQTGVSVNQSALVFGIGTKSNNALNSSAVVLPIDTTYSDPAWLGFTTVFDGASYPNPNSTTYTGYGSYLDSGSNAIFFLDTPTTGITDCPTTDDYFYCPNTTETFTAVNQATSGSKSQFQFNVSDANALSGGYTAFSDLAGPNTGGTSLNSSTEASDAYFAWGLSFFYGRNVYTAIWGVTAPSGVPAGPFWAY